MGDYTCTYNPPILPRGLPGNLCLFEILRARKRQSEILRARKGQSEGLSQGGQVRLIGEGGDNNTVNRPAHIPETRLARAGGAPGNSGETSANLAASQVHALEHLTHSAAGNGGGRTASSSVARDEAGATAYRHITQEQLLTDTLLRSASSSLAGDEAGATALTSTSAVVQLVHGACSTAYYESEASYTPRVNLDRSEDVIDPHSERARTTPHRGISLSLSLSLSHALSLSLLFVLPHSR